MCREGFVEGCGGIWSPGQAQEENRYDLGQGLPPRRPLELPSLVLAQGALPILWEARMF